MYSENDLHSKVVDYIRRFHPHAKMVAGLGEFQSTSALRIDGFQKGCQKGTADLMIMNKHMDFIGFCFEFKAPRGYGSLAEAQDDWLNNLHLNDFKVMAPNDYDTIIKVIANYFQRVRLVCHGCITKPNYFETEATLQQHIMKFHRKNT